MSTKYKTLLTFFFVLITTCELKAQIEKETVRTLYSHKIIAVLPFMTTTYSSRAARKDTSIDQSLARETDLSIKIQEGMYNALMADTSRLLVKVQDWKVTDSILKAAGVDLRKANFEDPHAVAALLKVDAVLGGSMDRKRLRFANGGLPMSLNTSILGVPGITTHDKRTHLFVELLDGESGEPIWQFDKEVDTIRLLGQTVADKALYSIFLRKFPYRL